MKGLIIAECVQCKLDRIENYYVNVNRDPFSTDSTQNKDFSKQKLKINEYLIAIKITLSNMILQLTRKGLLSFTTCLDIG